MQVLQWGQGPDVVEQLCSSVCTSVNRQHIKIANQVNITADHIEKRLAYSAKQ